MQKLTIKDELTEFLLYTTPSSEVKVEIFMHDEIKIIESSNNE